MQPGVVGLRSAVTGLWAEDLRAVREDRYDTDRGKEALAFIQRFNAMVSHLRGPIQQAWGPGGLVHVADNPDVAGPGQRVSQVRVKLRNHGDAVVSEGFGYSAGSPSANGPPSSSPTVRRDPARSSRCWGRRCRSPAGVRTRA